MTCWEHLVKLTRFWQVKVFSSVVHHHRRKRVVDINVTTWRTTTGGPWKRFDQHAQIPTIFVIKCPDCSETKWTLNHDPCILNQLTPCFKSVPCNTPWNWTNHAGWVEIFTFYESLLLRATRGYIWVVGAKKQIKLCGGAQKKLSRQETNRQWTYDARVRGWGIGGQGRC